jgi:hypothetical protein
LDELNNQLASASYTHHQKSIIVDSQPGQYSHGPRIGRLHSSKSKEEKGASTNKMSITFMRTKTARSLDLSRKQQKKLP